jgi:hypothetical protein
MVHIARLARWLTVALPNNVFDGDTSGVASWLLAAGQHRHHYHHQHSQSIAVQHFKVVLVSRCARVEIVIAACWRSWVINKKFAASRVIDASSCDDSAWWWRESQFDDDHGTTGTLERVRSFVADVS